VLLHECDEAIVSLAPMTPSQPIVVEGSVLVERGDVAVWFIFPNAWHDAGLVYDRERRFKGFYCDIMTPARRLPEGYEITDLFLDLWVFPDARYAVLDREEFTEALNNGWLPKNLAQRAEKELLSLIEAVEERSFPQPILKELGVLPEEAGSLLEALRESQATVRSSR
ncbi:MAG: DUF402 domain-containing protein, partial [Candidatus Bathyarchaeia archaeon]